MPNPMHRVIDLRASNVAKTILSTRSFTNQAGNYRPVKTDSGIIVSVPSGNVFITTGQFDVGDVIMVHNNSSASPVTITQNASVTIYYPSNVSITTSPASGNRVLSPRGFASITCVAANTFVITAGSGIF